MFFKTNNLSFSIINVFAFEQNNVNCYEKGRSYNALSFRISADTQIYYNGSSSYVTDNSIGFFPAFCDYKRIAKHDKIIVVHFDILNTSYDNIEIINPHNPKKIKRLFEQLLENWKLKEYDSYYKALAIFYMILSECIKQVIIPIEKENPIYESVMFLENNFSNPKITVKEIADKSYISEVCVCQVKMLAKGPQKC